MGGPFGTVLANVLSNGGTSIDVLVTALEEKGVVRTLAEPNLIALSGDEAQFLAGGEFPVPVASSGIGGLQTTTIQFKTFGVKLKFRPIVLSRGIINLKMEPEVSELDFSNAQTIQKRGSVTVVPGLTTRSASTTVELRDGQSFAVAGLLSSQNRNNLAQVPWIGSVPVLGALFRSAAYQQKETDLVIIVTPRLIAPVVPGQRLATPLNSRLPANDVDFFLMGQPELKKEYTDYVESGGGLQGPYGYIIQPELPTPKRKQAIGVDRETCCCHVLRCRCGCPRRMRYYGNDEGVRYLQRKDTVTLSAGDASQVNAVAQTINPWPPGVGNRNIPMEGSRAVRAIECYRQGSGQTTIGQRAIDHQCNDQHGRRGGHVGRSGNAIEM